MAKRLSEEEIIENLKKIPTWTQDESGKKIRKKFSFKNFGEALQFANHVGSQAESMDHHPDMLLHDYRFLTLTLTTHSAGGLTRMDFDLAQKIETN